MQSYESSVPSLSYRDMSNQILTIGIDSKATKYRKRSSIVFDRSSLNYGEVALPKYRLDGSESSTKYALAEMMWYASKRLTIGLIKQFGPIWSKMTDENGRVNSNYGYQVFENNDFNSELQKLIETNECTFFIASEDNQHSRNDLVCNNTVTLSFNNDKTVLSVKVVARSIDMLYGYPYDMFAAQVFASYVIKTLLEREAIEVEPIIDKIQFDIENVHIYKEHINDQSLATLEMTDFSTYKVIELTDHLWEDLHKRLNGSYSADSRSVQAFRNIFSKLFYEKKLYQKSGISRGDFNVVRFDSMYEIGQYFRVDEQFDRRQMKRVHTILEYLKQDANDRKNLVVAGNKLFYITRQARVAQADIYEVSIHEF